MAKPCGRFFGRYARGVVEAEGKTGEIRRRLRHGQGEGVGAMVATDGDETGHPGLTRAGKHRAPVLPEMRMGIEGPADGGAFDIASSKFHVHISDFKAQISYLEALISKFNV